MAPSGPSERRPPADTIRDMTNRPLVVPPPTTGVDPRVALAAALHAGRRRTFIVRSEARLRGMGRLLVPGDLDHLLHVWRRLHAQRRDDLLDDDGVLADGGPPAQDLHDPLELPIST